MLFENSSPLTQSRRFLRTTFLLQPLCSSFSTCWIVATFPTVSTSFSMTTSILLNATRSSLCFWTKITRMHCVEFFLFWTSLGSNMDLRTTIIFELPLSTVPTTLSRIQSVRLRMLCRRLCNIFLSILQKDPNRICTCWVMTPRILRLLYWCATNCANLFSSPLSMDSKKGCLPQPPSGILSRMWQRRRKTPLSIWEALACHKLSSQ
mmetsp:Transcript_2398/g.9033  ORF Transcript_2398/g.9033 Transcript_2398/m.9033 type:complete len:207 (-) Transcript_2398:319-939(-)